MDAQRRVDVAARAVFHGDGQVAAQRAPVTRSLPWKSSANEGRKASRPSPAQVRTACESSSAIINRVEREAVAQQGQVAWEILEESAALNGP